MRPVGAGAADPDRRAATILLVDDNAADAQLVHVAVAELPALGRLHVARTGEEALRFLTAAVVRGSATLPDLVLLDLNLPGIDGRGVLAQIRADHALRGLGVVVLTSSADPEDVRSAYAAGANCYVTKPLDLEEYLSTLRALVRYWLAMAMWPDEVGESPARSGDPGPLVPREPRVE